MPKDQHFILTLGRSGSNTLVDALNQNPAILNYGEVLGDWMPIRRAQRRLRLYKGDDRAYLDALLGQGGIQWMAHTYRSVQKISGGRFKEVKRGSQIKSFGVKEFSLNLIEMGLADYLDARPHIKVIGLQRANPIERMASWLRLEETGVVKQDAKSNHKDDAKRLASDPEKILEALEIVHQENRQLSQMLERIPEERRFVIDYDELFRSAQASPRILHDAQVFLGVTPQTLNFRMSKIISSDPLDIFENAADIRRAISTTKFAKFLRETPKSA